jgi:hypothetical protein
MSASPPSPGGGGLAAARAPAPPARTPCPDEQSFPARAPFDFTAPGYVEVKDPCPVHDGTRWHLFGTGVTGPHRFEVLHATAAALGGPWRPHSPVAVRGLEGTCVAAPGLVAEGSRLHMFLQTDYDRLDGRIEHLVSDDAGESFQLSDTSLTSLPESGEAGIYDPHPAEIAGRRYLVYSAFTIPGEPDVHLARSQSGGWDGPWERLGVILRHEDVTHHNQRGTRGYEWGLEGAQLVGLPDGRVLLNAVSFLPDLPAGCRQRVFFAVGHSPPGPYRVFGPAVQPLGGDRAGENGHATALVDGHTLTLTFQERGVEDPRWRYGLATVPLHCLDTLAAGEDEIR